MAAAKSPPSLPIAISQKVSNQIIEQQQPRDNLIRGVGQHHSKIPRQKSHEKSHEKNPTKKSHGKIARNSKKLPENPHKFMVSIKLPNFINLQTYWFRFPADCMSAQHEKDDPNFESGSDITSPGLRAAPGIMRAKKFNPER